jgi:hypothetical protein
MIRAVAGLETISGNDTQGMVITPDPNLNNI